MSDNKSIKTTGSSIETRLLSARTYRTDLQEYLASFKRTRCHCCYRSVRTCIYTYSTVVWYWQLLQATVPATSWVSSYWHYQRRQNTAIRICYCRAIKRVKRHFSKSFIRFIHSCAFSSVFWRCDRVINLNTFYDSWPPRKGSHYLHQGGLNLLACTECKSVVNITLIKTIYIGSV